MCGMMGDIPIPHAFAFEGERMFGRHHFPLTCTYFRAY
jgi:hypothetical protein